MNLCGAILAGGESTRMGEPKEGLLMPDGRAMIEHVATALSPFVEQIVVVGASRGFDPERLGARRLDDSTAGLGPIGGLDAFLSSGISREYLVLTCDMPFVTAELLSPLVRRGEASLGGPVRCLRTPAGEELAPFPCLVSESLAPLLHHRILSRELSVQAAFRFAGIEWCECPPNAAWRIAGVNSRAELASALARAGHPDFPVA